MKIANVEILLVNAELNRGGKNEKPRPWRPIIVKVNTDEGICGYGEVGMAYGVGASAGWGMAKDLARLVVGMDPFQNEAVWEKMFKKTFWGQGGGTAVFGGMSAIDIALWDIKGKALGVPVYQLLGGACRNDLRVYASQIQFDWSEVSKPLVEPQEYAEAALRAVSQGYDAVKVDLLEFDPEGRMKHLDLTGVLPNKYLRMGWERLKAIREAVGPDVDIIVENHAETDVTTAIQFANAIEEFDVMYYEEAVTPLNPQMMKEVKQKVRIPLAAGERIYARWGYLPFFRDRSLDVIQPDLGTCGGLSEGKKICDMAHAHDITVQAHVCGSPIATAAALHLETALPNFLIHEHHQIALMSGNVALCTHDYQPENGRYKAPELPGLGQELTDDALRKAERVVVK